MIKFLKSIFTKRVEPEGSVNVIDLIEIVDEPRRTSRRNFIFGTGTAQNEEGTK